MTIQKTLLFGLSALLSIPTADAQCRHNRPVVIYPAQSYHNAHYGPHIAYHPHHVTSHIQTAELPPAPEAITYGAFSHVDELAVRLEILMNELCLDLYYNYSHNPGFHETYAEAYSLYQTARSIHAAEHNYDREHVRRQLGGADALFHHIEDDVRGWTRIPRRQIGTLGIITKMEMAEDTLHHLMEDVGVAVAAGLEQPPVPQGLAVPPAPSVLP